MSRPVRTLLAVVALAVAPVVGCADGDGSAGAESQSHAEVEGALRVVDATVEVPPNPDQAAARFVIDNGLDGADELVAASSPMAEKVQIHRSDVDDEGRATMSRLERLDIPARSKVTFAPGGLHVMMEGLREPLVAGETVELELTFAENGTRTVTLAILAPGTTPIDPDEPEHDHHVD